MVRSFFPPALCVQASTLILIGMLAGCVSSETHQKALAELEAAKKLSAQQQRQLVGMRESFDLEANQRRAAEEQAASLAKEREALEARSKALENEKHQLNSDLTNVRSQIADLEQKHTEGSASAQEAIDKLKLQAAAMEAERERLRQEQDRLAANLEQERAAKEEEIKRLTKTQEELSRSLQDEISKGNITIQQVRDRLTINMVDRVLFDSGQAQVKPAGLKVLQQVGDILSKVSDKQIRIEGHTDNVPISAKLQSRFKSNWELSTARATTVVRHLIEKGGVDRLHLSAVGYAETHPVASNDSEAGRASNRRIEIVLYPKDLKQIAGDLHPGASGSK
ncbi:MAG: OmpA family protein [Nitrospira sp.]|nr:OmpA family protein [Nitrospira sp.]